MLNNLEQYYKQYLCREMIGMLNIYNNKSIPKLEYIRVNLLLNNIHSIEDMRVLNVISFLENITGQKCLVKDLGLIKGVRGYSSVRKVLCLVTLRKRRMYTFFEYLIFIVVPLFVKRYGLPKIINQGKGMFLLEISDMNVFYNYKSKLNMEEKVYIIFKLSGNIQYNSLLLRSFGLKIIN